MTARWLIWFANLLIIVMIPALLVVFFLRQINMFDLVMALSGLFLGEIVLWEIGWLIAVDSGDI